jgi:peptide/nickel transport system permease protein
MGVQPLRLMGEYPLWSAVHHSLGDARMVLAAAGIMLALTVLSINFIGDGLRDALDPRLKPKGRTI